VAGGHRAVLQHRAEQVLGVGRDAVSLVLLERAAQGNILSVIQFVRGVRIATCGGKSCCSRCFIVPALHSGTEPDHSVDSSRPLGVYLPERIACQGLCCRSERFKGTIRVLILERSQYNVALLRRTGNSLRDALQHPSTQGRLPVLCSARAPTLFIAWSC
jgi:hypothetical protein